MKIFLASLNFFLIVVACTKPEGRPTITTTPVSKQDIVQKVTIAGNIEPQNKVIVVAPYDGYVKKLFVSVGKKIKKADDLVIVTESLTDQGPFFPLKAPSQGTVVQVSKQEGEFVRKGDLDNPIMRVDDLSQLYVQALAPELDYLKIRVGQKVTIRATALVDQQYEGEVLELFLAAAARKNSWGGQDQAAEFPVRIKILNADERLKPGMSVIVDIVADRRDQVLALPHDYVFSEEGKYYVNLEDGDKKEIQVGLRDDLHMEVLGLEEGTEVRQVNFYETKKKK